MKKLTELTNLFYRNISNVFLLPFLLVFLTCCSPQSSNQQVANNAKTQTDEPLKDSKIIEDYIIESIIAHYNDTTTKMETESTDSSLHISFHLIPEKDNEYSSGTILSLYFSKLKKDFVSGDINNDGVQDLIADISQDAGGSASWNDLIIFSLENNRYQIKSITNSFEVCGCSSGAFYPETIENGLVIGKSICWASGDASCCPTLEYNTTVKLVDNKLKYVSKKDKVVRETE